MKKQAIILLMFFVYSSLSAISFEEPTAFINDNTIPIFIGYTQKSVFSNQFGPRGVKIKSLREYESKFGKEPNEAGQDVYLLYNSIRLFYANGGKECYIISVENYDEENPEIKREKLVSGLNNIPTFDSPSLLVIPETVRLSPQESGFVHQIMLRKAEELGNSFAILDMVDGDSPINSSERPVENFKKYLGLQHLSFGAVYYPWLKTSLKSSGKSSFQTANRKTETQILPPGAAIAAAIVVNDKDRGMWKAPANISLSSVIEPVVKLSEAEMGQLNVDPQTGKSINPIRIVPSRGTVIWGARTLAGNDNEWRFISVRRTAEKIKTDLTAEMAGFKNARNDVDTWNEIRARVEGYLNALWRRDAMAGVSPGQAYFTRVGVGHTMTENDVRNRRLLLSVGVAMVRPAEFIVISLEQEMTR